MLAIESLGLPRLFSLIVKDSNMIKKVVFALAILFTLQVEADFKSALVGKWDYFDSSFESNFYVYLEIKDDFTGVLARSKDGTKDIYKLSKEDITIHDGYIEISVMDNSKRKIIFIVSAWKNKESKIVTGNMFLYNKTNNGLALFNTINLRMLPSNGFSLSEDIQEIHKDLNE